MTDAEVAALAELASLQEDVDSAASWYRRVLSRMRKYHRKLKDTGGAAWEAHKAEKPGCRTCLYYQYLEIRLESGGEPSGEPPT